MTVFVFGRQQGLPEGRETAPSDEDLASSKREGVKRGRLAHVNKILIEQESNCCGAFTSLCGIDPSNQYFYSHPMNLYVYLLLLNLSTTEL